MSPLRQAVDVLELVTEYLKGQAEVTTGIAGRVYPTGIPAKPTWPLVTMHVVPGALSHYPNHLEHPRLQFGSWGDSGQVNSEGVAGDVARLVRAAVIALPGSYDEGIVTGVDDVTFPFWMPDASVSPARPRYIFTALIHVHPLPA